MLRRVLVLVFVGAFGLVLGAASILLSDAYVVHEDVTAGVVNPVNLWRCDTPQLRLWMYQRFPRIRFVYPWDTDAEDAACIQSCLPTFKRVLTPDQE